MDQFVSLHGKAGHALLLDCRSLDYKLVPLSDPARLVVCNTSIKHALASNEYNERRAQCEAGVKHLASKLPNVKALRDVSIDTLEEYGKDLPDVIYRRCRHVVTENARTIDAARALERGDLVYFGKLMNESHRSLRDDYEVSCKELDLMVELAHQVDGVYGARLTGGGFGGCTVNLVGPHAIPAFEARVLPAYEKATALKPEMYVFEAADGASEVEA
jgi:galactokinase